MPYLVIIFSLLFSFAISAQSVKIKGLAPAYVGETVEIYEIEDYLSFEEKLIARAEVQSDSMFTLSLPIEVTQKVVVKCRKNWSMMYLQPSGNYSIFFPEKDPYEPALPTGNSVELSFVGLDSNDINYRILGFQRWSDEFMGNTVYLAQQDTSNSFFAKQLELFKTDVEEYYKSDTSFFLKTYIKFTIAFLENVNNGAERGKYEKYDFFIAHYPVCYRNDVYMDYLKGFYRHLMPRLSPKINEEVYQGILHSSPTMIMNSLGKEYTLKSLRLREMIMVKMLAEEFHSGDYPQTNLLSIIDSVATNGLFSENKIIARNISSRLTDLVPGIKAPEIVFSGQHQDVKTLGDFKGKFLYIHFCNPKSKSYEGDLLIMKDLHARYRDIIEFVTIYESESDSSEISQNLPWPVYGLSKTNAIWKKYKVKSFPSFMLIDLEGYIVANPALAPTPNGQYETIDKTFYQIRKITQH